jgi:predicted RNase H-like nuclease (RuvC/YqgF family)
MSIEQFTWLFFAVITAEIIVSLLAKWFWSTNSQIKYSDELLAAVNRARQDVMKANKLIEEMEAINMVLREQNQQLVVENMQKENIISQLKAQLNQSLNDIDYWRELYEKSLPNRSKKGDKLN